MGSAEYPEIINDDTSAIEPAVLGDRDDEGPRLGMTVTATDYTHNRILLLWDHFRATYDRAWTLDVQKTRTRGFYPTIRSYVGTFGG